MMPRTLELAGAAKLYGTTVALRLTDLALDAGEILLLLGPNGSGKSTLLRLAAGATPPTLGRVLVRGVNVAEDPAAARSCTAFLSADTQLYDDLTAIENLRFVATMAGAPASPPGMRAVLERVGLYHKAQDRVRSFSSGMKRRLSLARLLVLSPSLLLLDEPYTALDESGVALVNDVIREAADHDVAVILATHDADTGLALADRVAVLERGSMRFCGPVASYRGVFRVG